MVRKPETTPGFYRNGFNARVCYCDRCRKLTTGEWLCKTCSDNYIVVERLQAFINAEIVNKDRLVDIVRGWYLSGRMNYAEAERVLDVHSDTPINEPEGDLVSRLRAKVKGKYKGTGQPCY